MISATLKTQKNGINKLLNESDKLLSDKYILAKDIRDLNRTLQDSDDKMNSLEVEVKNRLKQKEQLEQYIHAFDKILKEPCFLTSRNEVSTDLSAKHDTEIEDYNKPIEKKDSLNQKLNDKIKSVTDKKEDFLHKINELIEKLNPESDLRELNETIKYEKSESIRVKQLMNENNLQITDKIRILMEKIENRNNANSEALIERDNLKVKMRNIIVEIAVHKSIEDKEKQL